MIEKVFSRKLVLLALIAFVIFISLFLYYFSLANKNGDNGLGTGPDSGTPKAFSEEKTSSKSATSSGDGVGVPNPSARVREANDRAALSKVRSVGTGVSACIVSETNKGVNDSLIYSTSNGCGDKNYLIAQEYLTAGQLPSDIAILVDSEKTKVCLYTLNSSGSGVVSYDSSLGVVSEAGGGVTTCD